LRLSGCIDTRKDFGREHVGGPVGEVHRRHLGTIKSVQIQYIISRLSVDNDSPIGVEGLLVVIGDDVGHCCARILNLNPPIRCKRIQCDASVFVQVECPVLPEDGRLDAGGIRGIGGVTILGFFEEPCVGEGVGNASVVGIGKFHLGGDAEVSARCHGWIARPRALEVGYVVRRTQVLGPRQQRREGEGEGGEWMEQDRPPWGGVSGP